MEISKLGPLFEHFALLPDPRGDRTKNTSCWLLW